MEAIGRRDALLDIGHRKIAQMRPFERAAGGRVAGAAGAKRRAVAVLDLGGRSARQFGLHPADQRKACGRKGRVIAAGGQDLGKPPHGLRAARRDRDCSSAFPLSGR